MSGALAAAVLTPLRATVEIRLDLPDDGVKLGRHFEGVGPGRLGKHQRRRRPAIVIDPRLAHPVHAAVARVGDAG